MPRIFNVPVVRYIGCEGISPDKDKVAAVADAPKPSNVEERRSFLGFLQYFVLCTICNTVQ